MTRMILSRLLQMALTLWIVLTVTFLLFRVLPGDPTIAIMSGDLPSEAQEALRQRFGLNQPLYVQYVDYLRQVVLHGDFGTSFWYHRPALEIVGRRLLPTAILGAMSFAFAYGVALGLASLLILRRNTRTESWLTRIVLVLRGAPPFWTGVLAVMVFAIWLGWFPHAGMVSTVGGASEMGPVARYFTLDFARHAVLPTMTYGLYLLALPTLILRATMLGELPKGYVEYLRAKGTPERRIVCRHVLKNSLLPYLTLAGMIIGVAMGGIIAIEYVFSWPGMGLELVQAIARRDYPVAQVGFVIIATTVVLMNFAVDLLYQVVDPRVRLFDASGPTKKPSSDTAAVSGEASDG